MTKSSPFDNPSVLDFAPESYWMTGRSGAGKSLNEFERRQRQARDGSGSKDFRHPPVEFAYRGGDFLPEFRKQELEIARLALDSTTWDVVSIRARPTSRGIAYRVVCEYEGDMNYSCRPKSSRRPLSMRQLVELIDGLTVDGIPSSPSCLRADQVGDDITDVDRIREAAAFVTVSSDFYPSLEAWYKYEAERWVEEQLAQMVGTEGSRSVVDK